MSTFEANSRIGLSGEILLSLNSTTRETSPTYICSYVVLSEIEQCERVHFETSKHDGSAGVPGGGELRWDTEDTQRSIAGRRRGTSTFHRQIFKNDRLVESHRRLISETSIFEMSPRDTK